jgi:hypothetical protein
MAAWNVSHISYPVSVYPNEIITFVYCRFSMSFSASIPILSCLLSIGPSFSPLAFVVPSLPVQDYISSERNRMFDCVRALDTSVCQTKLFYKTGTSLVVIFVRTVKRKEGSSIPVSPILLDNSKTMFKDVRVMFCMAPCSFRAS